MVEVSNPIAVTYNSGMGLASSKDFLNNQANYRVFIHSEART